MGGTFAHQIGRPEKSVRAGGNCCCFVREAFVGVTAVVCARSELIAEPAKGEACGLCYAHDVPAIGNCVTECVEAAVWIEGGAIGRRKNHAGCADSCTDYTSANNAHAHSASRLIACSGHYRGSDSQAGCFSAFLRKFPA